MSTEQAAAVAAQVEADGAEVTIGGALAEEEVLSEDWGPWTM